MIDVGDLHQGGWSRGKVPIRGGARAGTDNSDSVARKRAKSNLAHLNLRARNTPRSSQHNLVLRRWCLLGLVARRHRELVLGRVHHLSRPRCPGRLP